MKVMKLNRTAVGFITFLAGAWACSDNGGNGPAESGGTSGTAGTKGGTAGAGANATGGVFAMGGRGGASTVTGGSQSLGGTASGGQSVTAGGAGQPSASGAAGVNSGGAGTNGGDGTNSSGAGGIEGGAGGEQGGAGGEQGGAGGAVSNTPVLAGIHLTWVLRTSSNSAAACSSFATQAGVEVAATPRGSSIAITKNFLCEAGVGDLLGLAPADYTFSVSLLDSNGLALAASSPAMVTLANTGCDRLVSGNCVRDLGVVVTGL